MSHQARHPAGQAPRGVLAPVLVMTERGSFTSTQIAAAAACGETRDGAGKQRRDREEKQLQFLHRPSNFSRIVPRLQLRCGRRRPRAAGSCTCLPDIEPLLAGHWDWDTLMSLIVVWRARVECHRQDIGRWHNSPSFHGQYEMRIEYYNFIIEFIINKGNFYL